MVFGRGRMFCGFRIFCWIDVLNKINLIFKCIFYRKYAKRSPNVLLVLAIFAFVDCCADIFCALIFCKLVSGLITCVLNCLGLHMLCFVFFFRLLLLIVSVVSAYLLSEAELNLIFLFVVLLIF